MVWVTEWSSAALPVLNTSGTPETCETFVTPVPLISPCRPSALCRDICPPYQSSRLAVNTAHGSFRRSMFVTVSIVTAQPRNSRTNAYNDEKGHVTSSSRPPMADVERRNELATDRFRFARTGILIPQRHIA